MEPFTSHTGKAAPLLKANVDTDQIIPKQFLKRLTKTGYEDGLFYDWRFKEDGKTLNPDFVLNKPQFKNASILIAGENFGGGSSREHAVWALKDYGFKTVIAPEFADIFHNNSTKNGLLLITLPVEEVEELAYQAEKGLTLTIDLPNQTVKTPNKTISFQIDENTKHKILTGEDEIASTLKHANEIEAFEAEHKKKEPWVFGR
ncbi:Methanogen homoaconitase small subunit [uncultured archaeon]|nr:Methanogen homoaconitase small subunit [uncultured archaeon]